ncbi:hypothetical protein ACG7TL_005932 [Trametes sanguinea]
MPHAIHDVDELFDDSLALSVPLILSSIPSHPTLSASLFIRRPPHSPLHLTGGCMKI